MHVWRNSNTMAFITLRISPLLLSHHSKAHDYNKNSICRGNHTLLWYCFRNDQEYSLYRTSRLIIFFHLKQNIIYQHDEQTFIATKISLNQCFSTFCVSRHPYMVISVVVCTAPLNEEIELLFYEMWNLAAPIATSHRTLVCHGTPVGNHFVFR